MFRLSDLGKGKRGEGEQPQPPPPPSTPVSKDVPPPERSEFTKALTSLEELYEQLLGCVKRLFEQARPHQTLDLSQAIALIGQLPRVRDERCEALLYLVDRHTEENYLYSHSVNVALLVNHLGYCLGYLGDPLSQLVLAALLHDIGMAGEAEQVAALPRKLTEQEWKTISQHPHTAIQQLKDAQHLSQEALNAIAAHHEREKGQGYPGGLPANAITEFAKIIAVCDVYDALTHPRSYRKRFSPAQAVKMLIDGVEDEFDRRVVKAMVDEVSLYPRGSRVKLNTEEIGIVERVHLEAPLRPIVLVSHDANRYPLPAPRRVDLLEQPFLYVKEIVGEEE